MSLTILSQDLSLALLRGFEVDSKFLSHLFECYPSRGGPWFEPRVLRPGSSAVVPTFAADDVTIS